MSIDDTEALLGGLASKRHAAQLATDALHRALSAAAASSLPLDPATRSAGGTHPMPSAVPSASPSPSPAASTRPSRRCSNASAGVEVVAITVKLWADPETDGDQGLLLAGGGARGARGGPLARHPALHPRPRGGLPPPRRRPLRRRLRRRADAEPLHPLQRRSAARGDARPRRSGSARRASLTGHYARIVEDARGPLLAAGADAAKDQSYMLAALPPELLGRLGFPLTEHDQGRGARGRRPPRPRGREEARVARTSASSPARASSGFLRRHGNLVDREGAVVDRSGRTLGRHRGHHNFTVGQRRGIGVSLNEPGYVVATDAAANTVTVGTREDIETRRIQRPRRDPPPRRRPGRQRPPALPLGDPARHARRRRAGPPQGARAASSPSPSTPPLRARPRC